MAISKDEALAKTALIEFDSPEENAIDNALRNRYLGVEGLVTAIPRPQLEPSAEAELLGKYRAKTWEVKAFTDGRGRFYLFN